MLQSSPISEKHTDILYDRTYESLIREIDAIDNGVELCHGEAPYVLVPLPRLAWIIAVVVARP